LALGENSTQMGKGQDLTLIPLILQWMEWKAPITIKRRNVMILSARLPRMQLHLVFRLQVAG
jgi:hypothetical protein